MRWKCGLGGKGANFLRTGFKNFFTDFRGECEECLGGSVGAGRIAENMNFLKRNLLTEIEGF